MSSFRRIQPAPSNSKREKPGSKEEPSILKAQLGKRIRSVAQACYVCRQVKARCDGLRPKCGPCAAKGKPCGYDGEAGQSRQEAMKSRLEALEKLFSDLQGQSPREASDLLDRIRSADDLMTVRATSQARIKEEYLSDTSSERDMQGGIMFHDGTESGSAVAVSASTSPLSADSAQSASLPLSSDTVSSIEPSREASKELAANFSWGWIRLSMPDPATTKQAIDSFFACSGKLFHMFSREQAENLYQTVFEDDRGVSARKKMAAVCCLTAVAAVGVQYGHGEFAAGIEGSFYDISRHCFDYLLETDSLDVIKACTLFAMYNVMGKATVSLAYVEIGLGMSRRHGLDNKEPRPGVSPASWIDYRRAWRTLIFFSSWLSSTLGYMSGDDFLIHKIQLSDMDVDGSEDISSVVQAEMTKICLLKAEILRMHLTVKDLTVQAIESIMKKLQEWYGRLPSPMHIANLGREDIAVDVRRSIYHVHLLYLGAIILLYRRIASEFVRSYGTDRERDLLWRPLEKLLISNTEEGILAAKHSARILSMLLAEDGVFKRCWLVIFQSYTSCLVVLHSVSQKQLHNFAPSEWQDDLEQAKQCLDVLAFCGTLDPVAAKFHRRLAPIYEEIACFDQSGSLELDRLFNTTATVRPEYLLIVPEAADPARIRLSLSLLLLLCRPFGDGDDDDVGRGAELDVKNLSRTDPTRYEHPQFVERLEWDCDSAEPFKWDLDQLGLQGLGMRDLDEGPMPVEDIRCDGLREVRSLGSESSSEEDSDGEGRQKMTCNVFLMSSHPNGWMSGNGYFL